MSAEEFFQVLADSQLYRAFPWYYQGIGPFVVFLIALFCSMYLIWRSWTSTSDKSSDKLSDTSLKGRWQEHKKSSTPTKDFLTDAYVHLGIARIVVTLVALLVASSSFGLCSHPLWLLRLLNPQIDSLYDLTPNGVQFVVDYLMAVTILSVFTAFCLFVMATGTYWLEKREITPVDELIELMRRGRANKKKPLSPGVVFMGIGLILLVGIVTNLNTKYQDVTTRQEVDSRVICDGQKSFETVERIWEEVKDVKSRWKHTLAVRFSDAKVPPELVTVQMGSQRETVLIEGEASAHFDPLSVVVVPLIEGELSNSEQKFAAEVLRVLLAGFALRGVENYDKAWLYLPSVSSSNLSYQKKEFLWANAAANELYLWLRFTRTELDKATLVGFLVRVASDLPTPNIGEGQSDAKPVLILYRWFPRHQPEYLNIASVYNQLWNDNFQLWIVDLTSSRYRDHVFEIGLRPEIFHVTLLTPDSLVNKETGLVRIEPIKEQLESGLIKDRVRQLRSTRLVTIETNKLLATRDSAPIYVANHIAPTCYYPLDLGEVSKFPLTPSKTEETLFVTPSARTRLLWSMLVGLGLLYPFGTAAAAILRYVSSKKIKSIIRDERITG